MSCLNGFVKFRPSDIICDAVDSLITRPGPGWRTNKSVKPDNCTVNSWLFAESGSTGTANNRFLVGNEQSQTRKLVQTNLFDQKHIFCLIEKHKLR